MSTTEERYEVVGTGSRVRIHTFAEGLFAKLAHDLELTAKVSGHALRQADGRASFDLELPVESIEVVGARKSGAVDASALSASDRGEIIAKMRQDVFRLAADGVGAVHITGELDGGRARAKIDTPRGASARVEATADVSLREGKAKVVLGLDVSLSALGSAQIKGPMGAFRVKDVVQIFVELELERV
ncbi:MAG: hypothetical protein R3B36_12865 [Polyangiaceae bacterium]